MNLFDLFIKISVDDQASRQIETLSDKLGSGLQTAAKIGVAAVGAAASGVVALTKSAVENYAEYEQLVGGVETLFKESADAIQQYAANAYQTAGMSANNYMSTVTSFAASLIQSLEGDTTAAVEYANTAITDMSDNANKMGTDISMIQNAYQGFAKGNYTMLDNLKLGYGGTATEMARLVNESGLLSEAQKINLDDTKNIGAALQEVGFDTIVQAIHAVQVELGISGISMEEYTALVESGAMTQEEAFELLGTTAKEAASTISGSLSSAGAAWSNLLTGMADDNADFETLVDEFVYSVGTAAENLLPRIETALNGVADLIEELFPVIMDRIPEIMNDVLPNVVDSGVAIVESFVEGLSENEDSLVDTAFDIVMTLINSALDLLPDIVELGINIIGSLVDGLIDALPNLMEAATDTIITLAKMLVDPVRLMDITNTAMEIIITLVDGLIKAIPELIDAAVEIILGIADYLLSPGNQQEMVSLGFELISKISVGLLEGLVEIGSAVLTLISEILYKFGDTDWLQIGKDVVNGILKGLKNTWDTLTDWLSNAWDDVVGSVKDFLGIHSPSRVFADIGKNMALGVGEGWSKAFDGISDDITSSMDFERSIKVNASGTSAALPASGVSVVQNIYASKMTPSEVMDEAIYYQKKAVLFGV